MHMEFEDEINELRGQGLSCAQIVLSLGMDFLEIEDKNLLKAAAGFERGIGCEGRCGAIAGGCMLIGLIYSTNVDNNKPNDESFALLLSHYCEEVEKMSMLEQGSCRCEQIVSGYYAPEEVVCPEMIEIAYTTAMDLLEGVGAL